MEVVDDATMVMKESKNNFEKKMGNVSRLLDEIREMRMEMMMTLVRSRPGIPSPPTRSPITFADLLPEVGKMKKNQVFLNQVVEAMVRSGEQLWCHSSGSFAGGLLWACPEVAIGILLALEGTEDLILECRDALIWTEEHRFCHLPDPWCTAGWNQQSNELMRLGFWGSQCPEEAVAGTTEIGFWVPPDGGRCVLVWSLVLQLLWFAPPWTHVTVVERKTLS